MTLPGESIRRRRVQRGWPRGTANWRSGFFTEGRCPELPDHLPVPWINGTEVVRSGDWHSFRKGAIESALARNCVICGLHIDGAVFLAAQDGAKVTSGCGGHARCILLTVKRCPHMVEVAERSTVVAWRYEGEGIGVVLPDDPDGDGWGDRDAIDESASPLTVAELAVYAREEVIR